MHSALRDIPAAPSPHQRTRGRAAVGLALRAGRTELAALHQEGSAKAILPRTHGGPCEVVFLNTAGGLTGGDRLDYALDLPAGARATATTQTAERAYRAGDGEATVGIRLSVGAGGWLDWLPQETILFDGAALSREITVDLAPGAGCLFLETAVLGRHAMGETVTGLSFSDTRMVRQDGVPVWAEPLRIDTRTLARGGNPAMLGGARALATLALIRPDAGDLLAPLRTALDIDGVEAAATAMDNRLILRLIAWDALPLRRQVLRALAVLRPGPLPRVWQV